LKWAFQFQLAFLEGSAFTGGERGPLTHTLERQIAFSWAIIEEIDRAGYLPKADEMWGEEG